MPTRERWLIAADPFRADWRPRVSSCLPSLQRPGCSPGDGCQLQFPIPFLCLPPSLCMCSADFLRGAHTAADSRTMKLRIWPPTREGRLHYSATQATGHCEGLPQQIAHMFKGINSALAAANSSPSHPPSPPFLSSRLIWFSHSIVFSPEALDMG